MKVIVICDDDGHTTAYAYTIQNLTKIFEQLEKNGELEDDFTDCRPYTLEAYEESLLESYAVNSRGGKVHLLDIEEKINTLYI